MATTKLLTYFDTYATNHLGDIWLTGILDVQAFRKVHFEILQWPHAPVHMTVTCSMGKLSGQTLGQLVGEFALGTPAVIHSFEVIGPEFNVVLTGGPAETKVPLQAWIFMN